ncbi:3-isopropylmalate dehydratase small subunit [Parasphingopyxis lamellibrachiae]|uniref:3-isopropylmalate dehydratase small subunit n=1 Tax=Parasphingopyxis lamellibrachiae TaxID=680125 RepID=A0A3D9FB55_9SPHN|nr:3-isopropylmalate dehydratase small subunit [Parasphingopyxis lamellibrachiae]RED15074.1 3-isopropylmalate/(R)-2-methylmalate dehydratase small subunit [Parasphingopyxis lamellibrachiae]
MEPFKQVEGRAYPFGRKNVDTDVIIPAEYLKTISREGLFEGAFKVVRAEEGNVFDDPEYAGAPILIAGDNFGCGSSREHAAWALNDMGIRVVVAPSFSDIFSSNAFKNGILAVELSQAAINRLMEVATTDPITVDLENQVVTTPFQDRFEFPIDAFRKSCLVAGLDEIGLTLESGEAIASYEQQVSAARPWLIKETA